MIKQKSAQTIKTRRKMFKKNTSITKPSFLESKTRERFINLNFEKEIQNVIKKTSYKQGVPRKSQKNWLSMFEDPNEQRNEIKSQHIKSSKSQTNLNSQMNDQKFRWKSEMSPVDDKNSFPYFKNSLNLRRIHNIDKSQDLSMRNGYTTNRNTSGLSIISLISIKNWMVVGPSHLDGNEILLSGANSPERDIKTERKLPQSRMLSPRPYDSKVSNSPIDPKIVSSDLRVSKSRLTRR
ncbi:unnamed protein product [Blepharisma stoltei]|uniref:Uncharacterized protein n=1 Tax=Blepharisma stoltei TaxID=1481888 RepID=A0AAU9JH01_9CILI|nr:unnamed protein product [Blepharisma stoltei]